MAITQIKGSNIEDGTVVAADVADDAITNAKVKSDAAIVTSKLSGAVTSITSHGLGTAATLTSGTAAGNVVVLDGTGKLPAVDGSALTSLPGGGGGWTQIATHTFSSAVQTKTFSSLDISGYHVVRLEFADVKRSNNQYTYLKISNDGFTNTNTWLTFAVAAFDNTTSSYSRNGGGTRGGGSGTELYLTPHVVFVAPVYLNGWIDFVKRGSLILVNGMGVVTIDGPATVQWSGVISASTFTDLQLHSYTGTFDSGTFTLMGMA